MDEDAQLVRRARAGNREAFDQLVVKYERQAMAVAYRLVGSGPDALDVVQEGFVRAYEALGKLKRPRRFRAWLMQIVVNQALNRRRQRARQGAVRFSELAGKETRAGAIPETLPAASGPEAAEIAQAEELDRALREAIDELPEALRTALLLFAVEKLPQKEVAEIMGISVAAVKWNVFEARRRLRRRLAAFL